MLVTRCSSTRTRTKADVETKTAGTRPPWGKKKKSMEIYPAELGDYQMVSNMLVDAFYTDTKTPENNLSPMQKRGLARDQNLDLRARYGRAATEGKGILRSSILIASEVTYDGDGDEDEVRDLGCVALGTTPFVGNEAQLSIRDLYAYSNRARARSALGGRGGNRGQKEEDGARLRPVVANLAVRPEARRKGIAKKLMRECESICKSWGYQEIWLLVEKDNPKARKLYNKLGYKAVKEEEDETFKLKDGRVTKSFVPVVYMRKSLGPLAVIENARPVPSAALALLAASVTQVDDQGAASILAAMREVAGVAGVGFDEAAVAEVLSLLPNVNNM